MIFEFDQKKSHRNKKKHGIDFIGAQEIWQGETVTFRSKNIDEERHLVIGKIKNSHWTAIITFRGKHLEKIRIISVRRSRHEEKEIFERR